MVLRALFPQYAPVSYTHLDVYKRQGWWFTGGDLTALPQLLRETLHADRLPHSGAKLL